MDKRFLHAPDVPTYRGLLRHLEKKDPSDVQKTSRGNPVFNVMKTRRKRIWRIFIDLVENEEGPTENKVNWIVEQDVKRYVDLRSLTSTSKLHIDL